MATFISVANLVLAIALALIGIVSQEAIPLIVGVYGLLSFRIERLYDKLDAR
ncbi:hypothetical protein CHELA1G11_11195 [Hyphomicrobiales bacterium]|nr:hypothetical protein CHELA1G11_11195 [Hyphomicrobiales bacterium]CAH1669465.1 hypothetical protein CHELA1G2_13114 [Hyphomicrobiales bacterium]